MDVGGDRRAVSGDRVATRRPGTVQRSGRTVLPLLLLPSRRHDGHRRTRQQRHQLRALLHHERPLQADVHWPRLDAEAAERRRPTAQSPSTITPRRRRAGLLRQWRSGNVEDDHERCRTGARAEQSAGN